MKNDKYMKNVVFDLGGVVVDWSPERLMEEYTGDRAMPVSLFERGRTCERRRSHCFGGQ